MGKMWMVNLISRSLYNVFPKESSGIYFCGVKLIHKECLKNQIHNSPLDQGYRYWLAYYKCDYFLHVC
jgi:hypothetical protein